MVRILFKFITDSLVVVWHHVSAEVRVHTGRSVSVNMTVVLFLEISLTDRLNRSYSAVKENKRQVKQTEQTSKPNAVKSDHSFQLYLRSL